MDISELQVQITLTIGEMRQLVGLINLAATEVLGEKDVPDVVDEVSGLYFELMKQIKEDGYLGDFAPEQ